MGKTKEKHICELCAIEYLSPTSLEQHMLRIHPSPDATDFVCDVCGLSTFSKMKLRRHKFVRHEMEKHKTCPHCDFRCPDKHNMNIHIDGKHPEHGEKQFFCDVCGKGFIFNASMTPKGRQFTFHKQQI